MAYLALYRKWRPQTFTEVVGQKHISLPLSRAVEEDRLAHAYLFSGPRGTGKTSMAKILAKAVNCEHRNGADPCNACRTCREITSGASLDVYEIDAASNRGIEEIRALKESVRSLPTVCRKKVYIIDEVHMLTKEAFNALLKTLEEPPQHVLFILATTEPEKIPLTILSRCQRYEFRRISTEDIRNHLLYIAEQSGFGLTEEAADLIAVRAEGGLRDALSLLDQCSGAAGGKPLTAAMVYELLGLTGKDRILSLAGHILRRESGEALRDFSEILADGKEPSAVLTELLAHFRDVMIAKIQPDAPELSIYGAQKQDLLQEAGSLSEPFLDALFASLHDSLSDMKRSAAPRMTAEMGLLRLCRLRGSRTLEGLLDRIEALERQLQQGIPAAMPAPAAAVPASRPASSMAAPVMPAAPAFTAPPADRPAARKPAAPVSIPSPAPASAAAPAAAVTPAEEAPRRTAPPAADTPVPPPAQPARRKRTSSASASAAAMPASPAVPAAPSAPTAQTAPADLIPPAEYPALWKKILSHFMAIHRIDIYTCFSKSTLVYAGGARAVIAAPQPFIVQACNTEAFQKITAEAFQKCTGRALVPHTVLKGSPDDLRAREEASAPPAAPSAQPVPAPAASPDDGYTAVDRSELPPEALKDPLLAAALKIAPDCDIYEKK